MIELHRLKGDTFWINPDLVAFAEAKHDTVLTLLDGRHVLVTETPDEVAGAVLVWRASILAHAGRARDAIEVDDTDDELAAVRRARLAPVERGD